MALSFKGTKFERLASKIKDEIRKKKKFTTRQDEPSGPSVKVTGSKRKIAVQKEDDTEEKPKAVIKKSVSKIETTPLEENEYNNRRTVYIQGLPFTATESEVRTFLEISGKVKDIRLPKWQDSGKLRGYGHIEFETEKAASNALDRSGEYLSDRYIIIERPQDPRQLAANDVSSGGSKEKIPGCRKIFVKNLPYDATEEDLKEVFKVYGQILKVRFAMWGHTNNKKGFAYIDFKREDSAEIAVKKSGCVVMKSRKIEVDYETGDPKGGYKDVNSQPKRAKK